MRKISIWITTTVVIVALVFAYQLNKTDGGKKAPSGTNTTQGATQSGTDDKANDADANSVHTGKPGESKN